MMVMFVVVIIDHNFMEPLFFHLQQRRHLLIILSTKQNGGTEYQLCFLIYADKIDIKNNPPRRFQCLKSGIKFNLCRFKEF